MRFYLKPDFSHVWHKIPFWIPKYISCLSTQWQKIINYVRVFIKTTVLSSIFWFQRLTVASLWFSSYDYKGFLAWNLFFSNFQPKYRFDKSIARSTWCKKTESQFFFSWAPFLHIYEINFILSLYENLVIDLNLQFWAKKSFSELRI